MHPPEIQRKNLTILGRPNIKYNFFCRFLLLEIVKSALEEQVIVTHGTDTLIESALYLQSHVDQGNG